jgi:hypothetical protein
MSEWDGTLDLSGSDPDAVGFPAIPSGQYEAHIAKAEWKLTDNLDGTKALPHETRYLSLGIRVNDDEEPRDEQRVAGVYAGWTNLYIVPDGYDPQKGQMMKNRMANFLKAIGEDFSKKGYKLPDPESLVGQQVTVTVRKKRDDNQPSGFRNEIEGFKPAGSSQAADSGLLV